MSLCKRLCAIILLASLAACGQPSAARVNVQPPPIRGVQPSPTATLPPPANTPTPTRGSPAPTETSRVELGDQAGATLAGRLGGGATRRYIIHGQAGQTMAIRLDSPEGLAFSIHFFSADSQLTPIVEQTRQWTGQWYVAGDYLITVSSSAAEPAEYALAISTVEVRPLQPPHPTPPAPTAEPSPTPVRDKVLYLTFDDGPDPRNTGAILEILARHNALATFFVVGSRARAYPDLIQAELAAGHAVANHTYNHTALNGISREGFMNEVLGAQEAIGGGVACLRPPYGSRDANTAGYAAEIGYTVIMWDIDTHDWASPGADAISSRLINGARDGGIVLMHDGGGDRAQTIAALDTALTTLEGQGYRFGALCK
jgi:peptidoglycan/xylan/chitin deacetylase (PgdA/CDA1 family)